MNAKSLLVISVLAAAVSSAAGASASALRAMAALPVEGRERLVRIAACEGVPTPDRWHFVLYEPTAPDGLVDVVVSGNKVVSRNQVSQFVASAESSDVIGAGSVRIDSDHVIQIVQGYVNASGIPVATINYELRKDALGAGPVWKAHCLNRKGQTIGWVVVDAISGRVVADGGFPGRAPLSSAPAGGFRAPDSMADARTTQRTPRSGDADDERVEVRRAIPVERGTRAVIDPFRAVRSLTQF